MNARAALGCLVMCGCSFAFMDKPPPYLHAKAAPEPTCDPDGTPIIGDVALAVASGVAAVLVFTHDGLSDTSRWQDSGVLAGVSVAAAVSGMAGSVWADRCDRQRDAWRYWHPPETEDDLAHIESPR